MSPFRPIAFAVVAALAMPAAVSATTFATLLNGANRSAENKARDQYRHPAETLTFFGIKPTMTVVEVSPSAGWYTEILAPYLKDKGTYYAAHNNPAASERAAKSVETFKAKLASSPLYANVKVTAFGKDAYAIAPAGTADAVLTFRNVHNWYTNGFAPEAFKAFAAALKKGGTLGVVEHRLPEDKPDAMQTTSGYMKRSTVVKLAEDAGFRLVGESKVNANPKDTHDYPKGVWTLPPNYAEKDVDRAKYAAIGESDRMTLKFVKR
ncbi:class I SAM-dependent methyltransferase [Glacieibacterium frigidum]|uniref:Class I SAM-dependent methyltransferase n=1 Tax=Glacieibacterium frigidum TaxID=2593303 RepID=A0A552UIY6_9SPHN|nr:class I SAM-dependent methyltransferase [Glacieibacterium frigidum]TRW18174.1 class I SAM-dependent methyltransferase [Glacieibacterium frigidum]